MNQEKIDEEREYAANYEKIVDEAAKSLSDMCNICSVEAAPKFGIILGSGLGYLADIVQNPKVIPFESINNFPVPKTEGCEGKIISGSILGIDVLMLKGRTHYYDLPDDSLQCGALKTVFPVHVLANMGIKNLFVTNSARALNRKYKVGDIMLLKSHMSYFFPKQNSNGFKFNGNNGKKTEFEQELGMEIEIALPTYDHCLRLLLNKAGGFNSNYVKEGIYLAIPGPEYCSKEGDGALNYRLCADAIGMSTVNEAAAAIERGMKVVGFSYISNKIERNGTKAVPLDQAKAISESNEIKERTSAALRNFFGLYKKHYM